MLADGWPWTIQVAAEEPRRPGGRIPVGDRSTGRHQRAERDPPERGRRRSEHRDLRRARQDLCVWPRLPRAMVGAQLHVNPNGLTPAVSPLTDLDPAFADLFTALRVPGAGPLHRRDRRRHRGDGRLLAGHRTSGGLSGKTSSRRRPTGRRRNARRGRSRRAAAARSRC